MSRPGYFTVHIIITDGIARASMVVGSQVWVGEDRDEVQAVALAFRSWREGKNLSNRAQSWER